MAISWWMYLAAGVVLGVGSAFCAMLSLSAGTAYGTEYHVLSARQRVMARMLGVGALAASVASGLAGLALLAFGLRELWRLL
jgi:L-fucose isomerase-like protein